MNESIKNNQELLPVEHYSKIETPSGQFNILEIGFENAPDKVPVVFSPGYGETPNTLKKSMRELASFKHRTMTFDHPQKEPLKKHRQEISNFPETTYKYEIDKALNLLAVLKAKEISKADIIAHSEGAIYSIIAASIEPSKFRNIILYGGSGLVEMKDFLSRIWFIMKNSLRQVVSDNEARGPLLTSALETSKYILQNPKRSLDSLSKVMDFNIQEAMKIVHDQGIKIGVINGWHDQINSIEDYKKIVIEHQFITFCATPGDHHEIFTRPNEFSKNADQMLTYFNTGEAPDGWASHFEHKKLWHDSFESSNSTKKHDLKPLTHFDLFKLFIVEKAIGERGVMLVNLYKWLKIVDDVIDGDKPLPNNITVFEYINNKRKLIKSLMSGDHLSETIVSDNQDLLVKVLEVANKNKIFLDEELLTQMDLFETEYNKIISNDCLVNTKEEMIIRAGTGDQLIFRIILKSLGVKNLEDVHLGFAEKGILQRANWLSNIYEDLQRGLITIPKEDAEKYHIDFSKFKNPLFVKDDSFLKWYIDSYKKLVEDYTTIELEDKNIISKIPNFGYKNKLLLWYITFQRSKNAYFKEIKENIKNWG